MSRRVKITATETDEQLWEQWHQMLVMIGYENDKRTATRAANTHQRNNERNQPNVRGEAPKRRGRPRKTAEPKPVQRGKRGRPRRNEPKRSTKKRNL